MIDRRANLFRRGFTLVELIVVIVLLGILAAVVAPRLLVTDERRARTEVRDVAAMLSLIAQRTEMGGHHMALTYDRTRGALRLEALRTRGERSNFRERAAREWARDILAPEVDLSVVRIEEARFDGRLVDDSNEWRAEFAPGVPRAYVELVLSVGDSRSPRWIVELLPYSVESRLMDAQSPAAREGGLRAVDLDAMGMSEVAW